MGLYIKGMEMPKSCSVCPFCFGANNICPWTREYATYKGRHEDCPLVELPPHGDLIDRRELLSTVMQVVTKFPTSNIAAIEHLDLVNALLRGATVIIPAEKGETQ